MYIYIYIYIYIYAITEFFIKSLDLKAYKIACTLWQHVTAAFDDAGQHENCRWGRGGGLGVVFRSVFILTRWWFFFYAGDICSFFFLRDLARWRYDQYKTCGHIIENISCFGKVAWLHTGVFVLIYTTVSAFNMFYKLVSEHQTSKYEIPFYQTLSSVVYYVSFARNTCV